MCGCHVQQMLSAKLQAARVVSTPPGPWRSTHQLVAQPLSLVIVCVDIVANLRGHRATTRRRSHCGGMLMSGDMLSVIAMHHPQECHQTKQPQLVSSCWDDPSCPFSDSPRPARWRRSARVHCTRRGAPRR